MGLFNCDGVQGFRDAAGEILAYTLNGHLPWLHIDCHASSDDGLLFANGSELGWIDLCDLLRPINEACRFQLFVVVSTCYGAGLVSGIDTGKGAPCLGLIGPSHEVDPAELLGHFRDFYRTLFATTNITRSIESWKHRKLQQGSMVIVTAEDWWRDLISAYLTDHATPAGMEAIARRQRKVLLAEGISQSIGHLKRKYRSRLPAMIENRFNAYFMTTEVPENATLFAELRNKTISKMQYQLKLR